MALLLNRMSRPALGVAALTIAMFALAFWAVERVDPHYYYTVAVRAMSENWHNFFYGAYDPAGAITVEKVPGRDEFLHGLLDEIRVYDRALTEDEIVADMNRPVN